MFNSLPAELLHATLLYLPFDDLMCTALVEKTTSGVVREKYFQRNYAKVNPMSVIVGLVQHYAPFSETAQLWKEILLAEYDPESLHKVFFDCVEHYLELNQVAYAAEWVDCITDVEARRNSLFASVVRSDNAELMLQLCESYGGDLAAMGDNYATMYHCRRNNVPVVKELLHYAPVREKLGLHNLEAMSAAFGHDSPALLDALLNAGVRFGTNELIHCALSNAFCVLHHMLETRRFNPTNVIFQLIRLDRPLHLEMLLDNDQVRKRVNFPSIFTLVGSMPVRASVMELLRKKQN